jgi:hypothetical protein
MLLYLVGLLINTIKGFEPTLICLKQIALPVKLYGMREPAGMHSGRGKNIPVTKMISAEQRLPLFC